VGDGGGGAGGPEEREEEDQGLSEVKWLDPVGESGVTTVAPEACPASSKTTFFFFWNQAAKQLGLHAAVRLASTLDRAAEDDQVEETGLVTGGPLSAGYGKTAKHVVGRARVTFPFHH
jgi:hypothetical protein